MQGSPASHCTLHSSAHGNDIADIRNSVVGLPPKLPNPLQNLWVDLWPPAGEKKASAKILREPFRNS